MKLFIAITLLIGVAGGASADQYVNGYYRDNGSYVNPYHRSTPNTTTRDNYSTYGNTNPYTGRQGTVRDYGYGAAENRGYGIQQQRLAK